MEDQVYKFGQPVVVRDTLVGIVLYSYIAVGNDQKTRVYRILVDSQDCVTRIAYDADSQRGDELIKRDDFWELIRETTHVMAIEVSGENLKKLESVELDAVELEALIQNNTQE